MKTVHSTIIVTKCPHGCPDVYAAEFHVADKTIMVEDIQKAIDDAVAEPIYQEALTRCLANTLGCTVKTSGTHGQFHTDCTAEPETGE